MRVIDAIDRAQRAAPVDIRGLAHDLGIKVYDAWLDPEVSGELERTVDGNYQINVNADDPITRQRFTIAHEIGHYIYHRSLVGSGVDDNRAYRSTKQGRYFNTRIGPREETEANRFAASVLMPNHLIEDLRRLGLDRAEMAKRLQVSEHALAIRLGEQYP